MLRFWRGALPRLTPAVCRMATNRTACGILRFYSAGSRSPFARSRGALRLSGAAGSLWVWLFFVAISTGTGLRGTRGYEGTGLAARRECVFAQPHWLCCDFRGEYAGAPRPRLRQRVFDSLDSLHGAGRVRECFIRGGAASVRIRGDCSSGGSCDRTSVSAYSIVQTQAALPATALTSSRPSPSSWRAPLWAARRG